MVDIPKLVKEGNVAYEGFAQQELPRARFAWNQAKRAADLCVKAVQKFDLAANAELIKRWFGLDPRANPQHAHTLMQVQAKLTQMNSVFLSNPVTLVYAPNITVKHVPLDNSQPLQPVTLAGGTPFTGQNVYGYVHHHQAGSGYRVVLGKWFMSDPDQQEATQTVYHELTHKVLKTKDHCYGVALCEQLAKNNPQLACDNADSLAYFAKSMVGRT